MKKQEHRQLTPDELIMEIKQKKQRTDYERRAYRWLPDGMKKYAERNPGVAFENEDRFAYFPDIFFDEQKLYIEIDGGYHIGQMDEDKERDEFFKSHGYEAVHIKNADTMEELAFLEILLYELRQIKDIENRILVKDFIDALNQLINIKKEDLLIFDDVNDYFTTDDFELPMFNHPLMQRKLHNGYSLEI